MKTRIFVLFIALIVSSGFAQTSNITLWGLSDHEAFLTQLIEGFEAQNPEYTMTFEGRSTDAHKEIIRQVVNTTSAPDIYFMWGGLGLGAAFVDSLEPLDAYYDEYGWRDRFVDTALQGVTVNDQLYGVPYHIRSLGLFYDKAAFEQAGITEEPTTYEALVEANQKLVEAGYTPLSIGGKFGWMTMRLADALLETTCGAETHDALQAMEMDWTTTPCVSEGFSELKRWSDEGWLPANFLGVDPTESHVPVYAGEAAMLFEGDWMIEGFATEGFDPNDFGYFPFPTGTDRNYMFVEAFWIPETTKNKEGAVAFLDYLASPAVQQEFQAQLGPIAPTVGVTPTEGQPALVAEINQTVTDASGIYLLTDQAFPLAVVNEFFRAEDELLAGVTDPGGAAAIVQSAIESYRQ